MTQVNGTNGQANGTAQTAPATVLTANEAVKDTKSLSAEQVRIAQLEAEIAKLKEASKNKYQLKFKLAENSSCISVYGMNRYPTSLRRDQWRALLAQAENLTAFLDKHADEIDALEVKFPKAGL